MLTRKTTWAQVVKYLTLLMRKTTWAQVDKYQSMQTNKLFKIRPDSLYVVVTTIALYM